MENNKKKRNEKIFEEIFGDFLQKSKAEHSEDSRKVQEDSFLNTQSPDVDQAVSKSELKDVMEEYIPDSTTDQNWENFAERQPLPPLDKEQEVRAISIGLQELRKSKEYMYYIYNHMRNEFSSLYATYPLLLENYLDKTFDGVHSEVSDVILDMSHLISGDIDKVKAVRDDFRLYQEFEEKRLSILYAILDHYNNKNDI